MLLTLPNELLLEIVKNLTNTTDIFCLLVTSKELSALVQPVLNEVNQKAQAEAVNKGIPLLHYAALENNEAIAKLAIKLDPECLNTYIMNKGMALHVATWKGYSNMVKFLLENGSRPNEVNPFTTTITTPLNLSLRHIDLQQRSDGVKTKEHTDIAIQLLKAGADPNSKTIFGVNGLLQASSQRVPELVIAILETGLININSQTADGSTALHIAVRQDGKQSKEVIEELLLRGININAINKCGHTALFGCCSPPIVALLIKYGTNINIVDNRGRTILHHFADKENHKQAASLIDEVLRSKPSIKLEHLDFRNNSVMDYAIYHQNERVITILQQYQLEE